MNNYALFVAGEWIGADKRQAFAVINPADSSVIAQLPHATHVDVDSAMASARSGFELWRTTSPAERAKIIIQAARLLRERQEAIAAQMVAEQGKILSEARIEVIVSADILDWSAAEGMRQYGRQNSVPRPALYSDGQEGTGRCQCSDPFVERSGAVCRTQTERMSGRRLQRDIGGAQANSRCLCVCGPGIAGRRPA